MSNTISSHHNYSPSTTMKVRPKAPHKMEHATGEGHDPNANRLLEGFAQTVEGGHRQANKLVELGMNAVRHAPHHGATGALVEVAESPAGKVAGKVASGVSGGVALFEQFSAITNPALSEHKKSEEVWGAAFGAVGAVGGGALGTIEGMGVASVPLGVGGAIFFGEQGKKLGQEFGGWLVPEPHSGGARHH